MPCGNRPSPANRPGTARGDRDAPAGTSNARPCACHHLGETIDIHGGGNDLIFPHHENEIAQSESLTGKPLARYWMHNGMMQLGGEKMSKSLGNLVTIDEFLSKRSPDVLRMLIFTGHYRKPVVFNDETLAGAERSLHASARRVCARPTGNKTTGDEADAVREAAENARAAFIEAMDDDFNTSSAMAAHLRSGAGHQHARAMPASAAPSSRRPSAHCAN